MFGFSMGEILLLGALALIVIGPKQLPEFARQLGKVLTEIRRASGHLTQEIKRQAEAETQKTQIPVVIEKDEVIEKKDPQA